jgi:hypothetical protein
MHKASFRQEFLFISVDPFKGSHSLHIHQVCTSAIARNICRVRNEGPIINFLFLFLLFFFFGGFGKEHKQKQPLLRQLGREFEAGQK